MKLESIRIAQNGFVIEDAYGNLHIAKTLLEAAQIVGEAVGSNDTATYSLNHDCNDLNNVKHYARQGQKIEAIKILRNCFTARLGLKEAKDIVEILCGV